VQRNEGRFRGKLNSAERKTNEQQLGQGPVLEKGVHHSIGFGSANPLRQSELTVILLFPVSLGIEMQLFFHPTFQAISVYALLTQAPALPHSFNDPISFEEACAVFF
jgi:hypothetical protein